MNSLSNEACVRCESLGTPSGLLANEVGEWAPRMPAPTGNENRRELVLEPVINEKKVGLAGGSGLVSIRPCGIDGMNVAGKDEACRTLLPNMEL